VGRPAALTPRAAGFLLSKRYGLPPGEAWLRPLPTLAARPFAIGRLGGTPPPRQQGSCRARPDGGTGVAAERPWLHWPLVVKRIVLASPRGWCAGVERAVETVERALEQRGAPVYVRKQIVHNLHVVRELEARGAVFVDCVADVPEGETVVFSAHGVAPSVHARARARRLDTIDATCPLVSKVHAEARHYARRGYTILLIGHAGHEEVEGTMGEVPGSIVLVQSVEEAERLELPEDAPLAYLTQTTLSVDETGEIVDALRRHFPHIEAPPKEDICYATTNRQLAVKEMLDEIDVLLVVGSRNSSNSNRLVEVARASGCGAYLIDTADDIDDRWLEGAEVVGVTSGASAPESLVQQVVAWFRRRGVEDVRGSHEPEEVFFRLPLEVREPAGSA
jgi:4-hydroxy-3-methylbut-2-en-1-yl diphosphate reductase